MEDASGMDLQWFFRGFFEETRQLDQAIGTVEQHEDRVKVTFLNLADWVCPVDVVIVCEDETIHAYKFPVTVWAWSNKHTHEFQLDSQVVTVTINPSNTYPDIDFSNNHWGNNHVKK